MEPIQNETINEIFHAPIERFAAKWNQLDWNLYLKYVREKKTDQFVKSNWTYYERVKARSSLTADEFQLVTINALNILARLVPSSATNGLVYGEVQSGKTTSMIVLAALAFDLGFKAVILVSGRINILRNQTQYRSQQSMADEPSSLPTSRNVTPTRKRKRGSDEDLIYFSDETESEEEEYPDSTWCDLGETFVDLNGSMESDDHMFWLTADDKDVQNIKDIDVDELLNSTKLFAVLKKVPKSLESFVSFIEGDFKNSPWKRACKNNPEILQRRREIKRKLDEFLSGPALIIDDECDDASVAATQRQRENTKGIPKRMFRIRNMWPQNGTNVCHYVGYSATPQANVMNDCKDEFFPHFFWELSTQKGLYLGSQMYLNEELKKKVIKVIPYEDYPNLNELDIIMPGGEKKGQNAIQTEFLQSCIDDRKATPSMRKFLAYYIFTGAIRIQRTGPTQDIDAIIAGQEGSSDPLSFFAHDEEKLNTLRNKFHFALRKSRNNYHHLDFDEHSDFMNNNFNARYAEAFYAPYFEQPLVLAKFEELVPYRVVLYLASDNGKFSTVTSATGNESQNVYILYYKTKFYRVTGPLEQPKPSKPLFHSAMVHASHFQDFIDTIHEAVSIAWSLVGEEINDQLSGITTFEYLDEVWSDLSDEPMTSSKSDIETVMRETKIKTAMCRGGASRTNIRTFDYSIAEGDRTAKTKPVPRFLIVIGGNMLSRGLTIEGLTVSWYTRASKARVADTTIQHQRWFGWRNGYFDLVRVFMQDRHVQVFTDAVKSEQSLREVFRDTALNNWRPDRKSAVLQEPSNGVLTNKGKNNVEDVRLGTLELRTPALEVDASRAVLEATVMFWKELMQGDILRNYAGDVVINVPITKVIAFLEQLDVVGMPDVIDLIKRLEAYKYICNKRRVEPRVNVGVPTLGEKIPEADLEEFTDTNSQFILKSRYGLHNRKRNPVIASEFKQLLGGKSQTERAKHQYIDAVETKESPLPDWIVTKDTKGEIPACRGNDAPALILIFFLHPRFKARGEEHYAKDAPEAGKFPLVALAGCFPNVKTGYVANKTVRSNSYIFPTTNDDEVEVEPQRKRAKTEITLTNNADTYY